MLMEAQEVFGLDFDPAEFEQVARDGLISDEEELEEDVCTSTAELNSSSNNNNNNPLFPFLDQRGRRRCTSQTQEVSCQEEEVHHLRRV